MMKLKFFSKLLDQRIAAYQRELIETHYKEVDNMYRQMRGWRHDYRGHIQTMKVLAAQGNLDGIKAYLDALDTDLNTVDLRSRRATPWRMPSSTARSPSRRAGTSRCRSMPISRSN